MKKYNRSKLKDIKMVEQVEQERANRKIKPYSKVIVSGNVIEVFQMDNDPAPKRKRIDEDDDKQNEESVNNNRGDRKAEAKANNSRRARNNVRRLVLANFSNRSKFITLTFRDTDKFDITNVRECNKEFKKFIQRMRYRYGNFKYVCVIEFQDKNERGAVHYHMISDLPYIPNKKLNEIWRNGFVKINDISNVDNVGAYMVKYMLKDMNDPRLDGLKAYQCSKGLEKPKEYKGYPAELIMDVYDLKNKNVVFTNAYESEYNGMITYKEYNLNRD